jgi:CubicO group peptidase (beta-lactamase class C family)
MKKLEKGEIMSKKEFLSRLSMVVAGMVFLAVYFVSLHAHAQNKVIEIEKLMQSKPLFNGTILVSDKGKVIFQRGYGFANFEWKIPNTTSTKFKIGSITKQFTAMLIMQLAEAGQIGLNDKISDYLPYYRKDIGTQITINHLLTHTSGLPSLYRKDYPEFEISLRHNPYSLREGIQKFRSDDLRSTPGTSYHYTNSGYYILGAIIEKVTGLTYEAILRDKILDPLTMVNTGVDHYQTILSNRASGHTRNDGKIENVASMDLSVIHAAGAMYSTVEDIYLWDQALYSTQLLSKKYKEMMFRPHLNNYGYGWRVSKKYFGSPLLENEFFAQVIEHSGRINGFNALLMRLVEDKHLIIILSNVDKGVDNSIAYELVKILYGK